MAANDYLSADKKFKLGDATAEVSFRGAGAHVIVDGDIANLTAVFAGQQGLSGPTAVHDTPLSKQRVTDFLQGVHYLELRAARPALRTYAAAGNPPVNLTQVDGTSNFFVIKETAAALVLLAAAFSTPKQDETELVRLIGLEAAANGGCGDDGWNLPSATVGDKVARQTALRRARDEVGSLSRWSILSRLQVHKLVASTQLALNHNDLPGLRLAYIIYIGKALDAYATQAAAAMRSCGFPGCVSKTTLTSFNATNQVLSLCSKHTQSASEFVADCFPTWANDCEDFWLSVGRYITHRAEQLMMCRVCDAPTPN